MSALAPFARIAWHGRINFVDTKAVILSDGVSDVANVLQWKDDDKSFDSGTSDAPRICAAINAAHADRVAAELEAAADAVIGERPFDGVGGFLHVQSWLRARAKAIREGGAA